jgi:hypothetical protein
MRMLTCLLTAAVAVVVASVPAGAVEITFSDCVDAQANCPASVNDVFISGSGGGHSYSHDITSEGFSAVTDTITFAQIVIDLSDDGGAGDGAEQLDIFLVDSTFAGGEKKISAANQNAGVNFTYLFLAADVAALLDGVIGVRLANQATSGGPSPNFGDFFFEDSLLTVRVERTDSVPIPGPTSAVLLGAAMLTLAGLMRRRVHG